MPGPIEAVQSSHPPAEPGQSRTKGSTTARRPHSSQQGRDHHDTNTSPSVQRAMTASAFGRRRGSAF